MVVSLLHTSPLKKAPALHEYRLLCLFPVTSQPIDVQSVSGRFCYCFNVLALSELIATRYLIYPPPPPYDDREQLLADMGVALHSDRGAVGVFSPKKVGHTSDSIAVLAPHVVHLLSSRPPTWLT